MTWSVYYASLLLLFTIHLRQTANAELSSFETVIPPIHRVNELRVDELPGVAGPRLPTDDPGDIMNCRGWHQGRFPDFDEDCDTCEHNCLLKQSPTCMATCYRPVSVGTAPEVVAARLEYLIKRSLNTELSDRHLGEIEETCDLPSNDLFAEQHLCPTEYALSVRAITEYTDGDRLLNAMHPRSAPRALVSFGNGTSMVVDLLQDVASLLNRDLLRQTIRATPTTLNQFQLSATPTTLNQFRLSATPTNLPRTTKGRSNAFFCRKSLEGNLREPISINVNFKLQSDIRRGSLRRVLDELGRGHPDLHNVLTTIGRVKVDYKLRPKSGPVRYVVFHLDRNVYLRERRTRCS